MGRSVIYRGIILEKEIEKNVYMSVPRNYCAAASITNRFLIVYTIFWRVLVLRTQAELITNNVVCKLITK